MKHIKLIHIQRWRARWQKTRPASKEVWTEALKINSRVNSFAGKLSKFSGIYNKHDLLMESLIEVVSIIHKEQRSNSYLIAAAKHHLKDIIDREQVRKHASLPNREAFN